MEEGDIAKSLHDFFTTTQDELCLSKGDIVQILKKINRHWCYGNCNGRRGNIPTSHLMVIDAPQLENQQELFVAAADFSGQQFGDLSFAKGDLIVGLEQLDSNWWRGQIDSRYGLFPTSYTWQVDSSYIKKKIVNRNVNMRAKVKLSMKAQLEEEIDLVEGETVHIFEIIDKDWMRGTCNSRTGIFPSAYVTILDEHAVKQYSESRNSHNTEDFWTVKSTTGFHDDSFTIASVNRQNNNPLHSELEILDDDYFQVNMPSTCGISNKTALDDDYFNINIPSVKGNINNKQENINSSLLSGQNLIPSSTPSIEKPGNNIENLSLLDDDFFLINMPSASKSYDMQEVSTTSFSKILIDQTVIPYGISLYPFYGQFENELSFHEGEIITIIKHIGEEWIEGKIDDRKGIFPVSYINIIVDCVDFPSVAVKNNLCQEISPLTNENEQLKPNSNAIVLYNFDAQMNNDITVKQGEVVSVIKQVSNDWCEVKNSFDKIGLCPRNHIAPNCPVFQSHPFLQAKCDLNPCDYTIGKQTCVHDDFLVKEGSAAGEIILKTLDALSPTKFTTHTEYFSPSLYKQENRKVQETDHIGISKENSSRICQQIGLSVTDNVKELNPHLQKKDHTTCAISKNPTRIAPSVPDIKLEETSEFGPSTLKRQSSDRLPHRPAPPIPLPGQKPVRRILLSDTCQKKSSTGSDVKREKQVCILQRQPSPCKTLETELEEKRKKNFEQRQNVISELVLTEKEYVRDLKVTYETFNLHNPDILESRGVHVVSVFGNILEVMQFAEKFLDRLQLAMKGKNEEDQCIGICFLEAADDMKIVYGKYCMNHDNALTLLEKYESNQNIQRIFNKGIETLRYQIACFDMGSILIKPVQRILKYPLILNELVKCTEDGHKDKPQLIQAVCAVTDVATYINEYKRRKDIVSKYLDDGNSTISSKISKLSLHSVAKKSTRLSVLVSSTLGFGTITKDEKLQEHEILFHSLEKTIPIFVKNVENFLSTIKEVVASQSNVAEGISYFYQERNQDIEEFTKIQKLIDRQFWKEFETTVTRRVLVPLNSLCELFEGPAILIQKCNDKFLDFVACHAKAEKNKDVKLIQDELLITRNNYEALNYQLLEELPIFISLCSDIFVDCLIAFATSRKLFSGKVTKQYLALIEHPLMEIFQGNIIESFTVKHNLVMNQLNRLNCLSKNWKCDAHSKKSSKCSPSSNKKPFSQETVSQACQFQSTSRKSYLQSKYSLETLFTVEKENTSSYPLELTVHPGHLVAVIKKQNPMGDTSIWFVDDGTSQGFLPSSILSKVYLTNTLNSQSSHSDNLVSSNQSPTHKNNVGKLSSILTENQPSALSIKSEVNPPSYEEAVNFQHSPTVPNTSTSEIKQNKTDECPIYEEIRDDIDSLYEEIPGNCIQPQSFYYALYDFTGRGEHTLNIHSGQVVKVLQQHDVQQNHEWWFVEDRFGKKGYVPGNFLNKYS